MLKISKKILVMLLLSIIFISANFKIIQATYSILEATIVEIGEIDYHLKYYHEDRGYTYATCSIVGYYDNGTFYPAYCLNRDLHGVGAVDSYTVDIDSIIEDNSVWRAVKNGYPYKTAADMGLNSDFDAFAVTKFAIYCLIGQADVNLYIADEGDEEGQAMLNALKSLVDIGQNGTETFQEELQASQVGDFTEDGNYYTLTYKVNSGTTISSYTIKNISGLSEGDIITDTNNNIKTTFNSGENFKVKILKTNLNKDKNINIEISASLKSYPMFYGKTRITGTQNYLLTASSYENVETSINTNLKLNTGKIIVNKIDSDTKSSIHGTVIEIYNSTNELIGTYTTDENGEIYVQDLYQGSYIVKEIQANENYILDEYSTYTVDVEYNKTTTLTLENEHKKGNLIVYKVDKDNNSIALGDIGFELYSVETGELIGTYYTDANGKLEIQNLRIGKYKLKEITTNQWYNLAEETELEIIWNETTTTYIENELKKGKVQVIKVDKDDNSIKIAGVKFEVQDTFGNILETITTNEEGIATTKEYVLRDYDKIILHEIETNEKYFLNNDYIEVTLTENETKTLTIENEKIKGYIEIVKTTSNFSKITEIEANMPLEGVVFEVYNSTENFIETITTNKEGIALTSELEKGTYFVKEVSTNQFYKLDDSTYSAEISANCQFVTLNIQNEPDEPDLEVEKNGPDTATCNEEIEYSIKIENTGNVALENFIWEDEIPTDFVRVTKINLGTYNQKNTYSLYYKTNLSDDYILLLEDLSTEIAEDVDFTSELSEEEYITNIKLDFGTVETGFKTNMETKIYCIVNSNVKNDDVFINKVNLTGEYMGYKLEKSSEVETVVYKILPLTGM